MFTLKDETAKKGEFGYWGRRGEQVLYDSWREGNGTAIDHDRLTFASSVDDEGHRRFYNKASRVEFEDGVYALRPAYDEDTERSLEIEWRETSEGVVCRDSTGAVHARVDDLADVADASTNAFPAYYEYDRSEQEFVVWSDGEKHLYNSRDELKADWRRIYAPFIPEQEFDRMPTEEDFMFVVFPDGDNEEFDEPQIYEKGDLRPLHSGLEISESPSDKVNAGIEESTTEESRDEEGAVSGHIAPEDESEEEIDGHAPSELDDDAQPDSVAENSEEQPDPRDAGKSNEIGEFVSMMAGTVDEEGNN